jgi:hypothetical protein
MQLFLEMGAGTDKVKLRKVEPNAHIMIRCEPEKECAGSLSARMRVGKWTVFQSESVCQGLEQETITACNGDIEGLAQRSTLQSDWIRSQGVKG